MVKYYLTRVRYKQWIIVPAYYESRFVAPCSFLNENTVFLILTAIGMNMIFYYMSLRSERILKNKKKLVGFARFWRVLYLADYQMIEKYLHFSTSKTMKNAPKSD